MSETRTETHADPRRRNLIILAAATAAMVAVAIFAVTYETAELAPKYTPQTFLPGLAGDLDAVKRVHVEGSKGAFDVVLTAKGWVVAERNSYPASLDELRKTLVGLAALETIEPKTARPDWYHYVDLDPPPRGNGILIAAYDGSGRTITSVILGKSEDIGDPGGAIGLFARKTDERQSWLVRSVFEPRADPADWMSKAVVDVDRARVQEVDVAPASGPAYAVKRDKPSDPDFTLSPVPKGREVSDLAAPDGVASALSGFTFDDAEPANKLDFSHATKVVTKTFDGLTVTANVVAQGTDDWATLSAQATPGNLNTQQEVSQINGRAAGWAYKLPAFKGQLFTTSLESLLKPVGAPAKTGQ